MLTITCLLWGDDPSQGFMINLSQKDTIYNLKQKIIEYLELGNSVGRRMKLYKLKEFITLEDERLRQNGDPKDVFTCESLDKPFQILDDYFSEKEEDLKEFPLDIIIFLNNDGNIPNAYLDRKENEKALMSPLKPITPVIKESTLVTNNSSLSSKKNDIEPSLFPSPPTDDNNNNENISTQSNINNINIDNIIQPRTKSIIFNIDRFPSPPSDNNNDSDNVLQVNNTDSQFSGDRSNKGKNMVYDIDQFPDVPSNNENYDSTERLTSTEEAPPSYDAATNKNINIQNSNIINSSIDNDTNSNTYTNSSNMNNNNNHYYRDIDIDQYSLKKKNGKIPKKAILITICLFIGVVVTTLLTIFVAKNLLDKKNEPYRREKQQFIQIGKIETYKDFSGKPTTTLKIDTASVTNLPVIVTDQFRTLEERNRSNKLYQLTSFVDVCNDYNNKRKFLTNYRWKMGYEETTNPILLLEMDNPASKKIEWDASKVNSSKTIPAISNKINNSDNGEVEEVSSTQTNKNELITVETDKHTKVTMEKDISLKIGMKLLRIVEINNTISSKDSNSYVEFTEENLEDITYMNNSNNTNSGYVEVRRLYRNSDKTKSVIIAERTCSGYQRDEYNLMIDPTTVRWYLIIHEWNEEYDKSKLQLEVQVNSTKLFWSDSSRKKIYFDRGQVIIEYKDTVDIATSLKLENDKDIIYKAEDSPGLIKFDVFIDMDKAEDPRINYNKQKKSISFKVSTDLNAYNALNKLVSSGISFKTFNPSNYYLWFISTFILLINYFII